MSEMESGFDQGATPPVTPPPDTLGGAYDVVRELGRGGMAVVYLARERTTGRERAIKVIHTRFLGDAEAVARFAREARLVAQLHHPNIVPIHSVERLDGSGLALVMDRVPGRTVKQIIRDDGPIPFEQVERILHDIADALGHAHARGIVHRDVKPENIFVDENSGHALLSDFGIARSMHGETSLTLTGIAIGTPTYMAPEQIESDAVDARSDLYSLGVVGWEMLTGQRPWNGETLYNVIYRQKHDDLPSIEDLRPDVPLRLVAAVEGLLEKSPVDRWSNAADFRAQLASTEPVVRRPRGEHASALTTETIMMPRRISTVTSGSPPPPPPPRRAIRKLAPVAAGIGLMISATLLFARQEGGFPSQVSRVTSSLAGARKHAEQPAQSIRPTAAPTATGFTGAGGVQADSLRLIGSAMGMRSDTPAFTTAPELTRLRNSGPPKVEKTTVDQLAPNAGAAATSAPTPAAALPPARVPVVAAPAAVTPSAAPASHSTGRHYAIAAGAAHTCLIAPDGEAYCWGGNSQGQLGTGGTQRSASPAVVSTNVRFASLAPGLSHTCGLTAGGSAYCWGGNDHGQLGDGTNAAHAAPIRVAGRRTFTEIVTGAEHSCALDSDGHAFCWGSDEHGQLGDGGMTAHSQPVAVHGGHTFSDIVTGWNHACGLTDGGTAYCWGSNAAGQIGDGSTIDRLAPTPVLTKVRFTALSGGSTHTCGITASGAAYCWGDNDYGQLGDGTAADRSTPTPVDGGDRFVSISVGGVHTCALTRNHDALCWGRNSYGQLGDGSTTDRSHPVRVSGSHAFTTVAAFGAHTCGTTTTDELFCWGYNLDGQLGDGTREHRSRPVYIDKPAG